MEVFTDNLLVYINTGLLFLSSDSASGGGVSANVSENQNSVWFVADSSSTPFLHTVKLNSYNLAFKLRVFFLVAVC